MALTSHFKCPLWTSKVRKHKDLSSPAGKLIFAENLFMRDFIIIGAAQAGLSIAYFLKKNQRDFLILDKENEIGASWLNRWDSLSLFTPSEFNNLPGMEFPSPKGYYPSKEDVADYFKKYAREFDFPIKLEILVEGLEKKDDYFEIKTNKGNLQAKNVIVGTGPFHIPYTPGFARNISPEIFQVHSNYYKNPSQLHPGKAMVVGAGDSGFQILDEISQTNRTVYFSGETNVKVLPQELLGKTLFWWLKKTGILGFNKDHWIGKKLSRNRQPIIGTDVKAILKRENVVSVGKTIYAKNQIIQTEKAELTNLKNIIWATGYRPNFNWIEGLELSKDGYPKHYRGVSNIKGLYFIGLPWLYTRGSATLGGIKKDAAYLAEYIEGNSNS